MGGKPPFRSIWRRSATKKITEKIVFGRRGAPNSGRPLDSEDIAGHTCARRAAPKFLVHGVEEELLGKKPDPVRIKGKQSSS